MAERLLDYDPNTGMKTWHSYDEATERTILRYEQDCEPILDANKEFKNHGNHKMGDGFIAAHIPSVVMLKWLTEYGVDVLDPNHRPAVRRLLNSSEWMHLKRVPFTI
jgi:hypothetical protein